MSIPQGGHLPARDGVVAKSNRNRNRNRNIPAYRAGQLAILCPAPQAPGTESVVAGQQARLPVCLGEGSHES